MNGGPIIRLPRLHAAQRGVKRDARQFNVVVCGRRWGKTLLGRDLAIMAALGGLPVGWFAPTYKVLDDAWRALVRALAPVLRKPPDNQEYRMELLGGGALDAWSLTKPDAGRSRAYGLAVIDEAAMVMDLNQAWEAAIWPTLTDMQGSAWFLSTPRGYDDFHTLWERGQGHDPRFGAWMSWQMPSWTNPHLPAEFIEQARTTMDPRYFGQEYGASFEEMTGRVYHRFDRQLNVRADLTDTGGDLLVGMDFNVNPMSACIAVKAGDELHFIDEVELRNSNTEEMCQELKNRYPKRRLTVYPDPSGCARKTSAPVGQTDFAIIRAAGFRLVSPNAAPPVVDRVNEVNALCANGDDPPRRRLLIKAGTCPSLIRGLTQLSYKDGASLIDKSSGLDHMPDAASYLVHSEFPLVKPQQVGFLRNAV